MTEFRSTFGENQHQQSANESCSKNNDDMSNLTMSECVAPNGLHVRIKHLEEELRNTQADKDFVWSLWRQLQVNNPDLTGAIACAIQREKEKAEQKDKKVIHNTQIFFSFDSSFNF